MQHRQRTIAALPSERHHAIPKQGIRILGEEVHEQFRGFLGGDLAEPEECFSLVTTLGIWIGDASSIDVGVARENVTVVVRLLDGEGLVVALPAESPLPLEFPLGVGLDEVSVELSMAKGRGTARDDVAAVGGRLAGEAEVVAL